MAPLPALGFVETPIVELLVGTLFAPATLGLLEI